ncbi:MAG: hypothetical protein PX483_05585 [Nostocales cyanobacterium LE14-WE4]|jgi:hypothetical protein|nr:hypothetical protein [Dolichospermum sp. OL01]MCE2696977.1 hypothetical protein [Anabaena sp. 49633_E8]MCO5798604.1 hypothetical protein [Dolichospermum sp. OL03]MCS6279311.1 hypothetical protein [Dolichospermum sp.]MDJ0500323.1 hypothetical protein [Nostocales cyanobacterium LE14-WE4]QSV60035.1 MAG: hypothetical protein HEQ29_18230 [Dolichospermum sp. LBC05a]
MDYDDLDPEEREIIKSFRQLSQSQKKAVTASKQSFMDWIKTSVSWVWDKIKGYANDLWSLLKGLF